MDYIKEPSNPNSQLTELQYYELKIDIIIIFILQAYRFTSIVGAKTQYYLYFNVLS